MVIVSQTLSHPVIINTNRHYDYDIFNRQVNIHLEVRHKAGCQVILYSYILKILLYISYICLKFPILHPKILYFSKSMWKKVESLILNGNFK